MTIKFKNAIFLTLLLLSPLASAANDRVIAVLDSWPGYVMPENQYSKLCTIDESGLLTYAYESPKGEKTTTKNLSTEFMKELQTLIAAAKQCTQTTKYRTYSGDSPNFSFNLDLKLTLAEITNEDNDDISSGGINIHESGESLLNHCESARQSLEMVSKACGMKTEVKKLLKFEASDLAHHPFP